MAQEIIVDYKAEIDKITRDLEKFIDANEELAKQQNKVQTELDQTTKAVDKLEKEFASAAEATKTTGEGIKNASKSAKTELSGLVSTVKSIGAGIATGIGAAFSVQAVTNFAQASVGAFIEAESNALKLRNVIINVSGESERAFDKLIKQANQLQKITVFSDDSIEQAQTALATFGLTADQIEDLIPKLADFATVSNKDIVSAAQAVGAGLIGMGREFKRYDIEVSATATKQENFNNILQGFSRFAGSAESAANSLTGSIQIQKNEIDDLQEVIGKRLIPIFLKLQQFALRAVKVVSDLFAEEIQTEAEKAAEQFGKIGTEFNLLIETLQRGNLSQEQRSTLIDEINTQYGEYLPNLLTEKSSLEEIAAAQAAVNKQLEGRILLVALEEDITRITKNAVAATKDLLQIQKDRIKAEKDLGDNAAAAQLRRDQLNRREALANELLRVSREELAGLQKAYSDLALQLGINIGATDKTIKAQNDLREATTDVIRELEKITDVDISTLEKIFIASTIGPQSFRDAVREAREELEKLGQTEFERDLDRKNKERVESFKKANKDIKDDTELTYDQILSDSLSLFNDLVGLQNQYANQKIDKINQEKDAQLEALDAQTQAIDENLDKRRISEKDAEAQRKKLLQDRVAAEDEADKKIRAIKRRQAIINKIAAIAEIAISTAKNVAAGPVVLIPYWIALGAAQAAIVAAQPIPYKKGTKSAKGGLSLVDEEGTEAIYRGRLTTLEKGDKVLTAGKTKTYGEALDAMIDNRFDTWVMDKYLAPRLEAQNKVFKSGEQKSFARNLADANLINVTVPQGREMKSIRVNNLDELAELILNSRSSPYR